MVISKVYNDRNKHGEGLIFVCLEDVQEIVILEEAHSSISDLQMDTTDTSYNSLKELWNQMFDFINFADFKNFLKFS